ncbi:MAG: TIGR01620 family protein [Hyphomicrobiales bacterium]
MSRKPQAFVLEPEHSQRPHKAAQRQPDIAFTPDPVGTELVSVPQTEAPALTRRFPWASVLVVSLFALTALWAGLSITTLIQSYFAQSAFMGWLTLAVAGVAGLAALAIIVREIWGLVRLGRIEHLQDAASRAIALDDSRAAREALGGIVSLYDGRRDMRWPLQTLASHDAEIMDPRDRVRLAGRILFKPLDAQAHRLIASRARRVTVLTAVTPAAALDILFVASQNFGLLRDVAALYGGRPSTLATLKLARMVITHLAVAGGLALSDTLMQQLLGKGLVGRLSARFGEGAVNGILTSRIGLAAMDVCRPIPAQRPARENLGVLLREVVGLGNKDDKDGAGEPQS